MNIKKLTLTALFIAISFIGSNIKIFGTIAFDSLPAFLGALLIGPWYGAAIGFIGHFFTSMLSGFPFGILVHGIIAVSMAVTMIVFAFSYKVLSSKLNEVLSLVGASFIGTIMNGPVCLAVLYPFLQPVMGHAGIMALLPILTIASLANVVLAVSLFKVLKRVGRTALREIN